MRSVVLVLLLSSSACGPNVEVTDAGGGNEGEPGDRPETPGAMYSPCEGADDCSPLEFCVFPPGEPGYCAAACDAWGEPETCAPRPGGSAEVDCLDIGLSDGRMVCTLDCSDGRSCPGKMRCEAVETPSGRRDVCF